MKGLIVLSRPTSQLELRVNSISVNFEQPPSSPSALWAIWVMCALSDDNVKIGRDMCS